MVSAHDKIDMRVLGLENRRWWETGLIQSLTSYSTIEESLGMHFSATHDFLWASNLHHKILAHS